MYERVGTVEDPAEGTHYASITSHGDNRVKLHSRVSKYVEGLIVRETRTERTEAAK